MRDYVNVVIKQAYNTKPTAVADLGGGFYGKVFLADIPCTPHRVVVKFFLKKNLCEQEKAQLELLTKYATLKVPKIYACVKAEVEVPYDAILMEYIEHKNAGLVPKLPKEQSGHIAVQIIDNLLAFHSVIHKEGFGEINAKSFSPDWNSCYKEKASENMVKATALYEQDKISKVCFDIMQTAYDNYNKIFYLPITEARLIHGDYNTWNILLNNEMTEAIAVIDPYNCCYADFEYDLYQLNNANGKMYGLLDLYKSKAELSENFEIKLCFYELFTEIMHYYDANVTPDKEGLERLAIALKLKLETENI